MSEYVVSAYDLSISCLSRWYLYVLCLHVVSEYIVFMHVVFVCILYVWLIVFGCSVSCLHVVLGLRSACVVFAYVYKIIINSDLIYYKKWIRIRVFIFVKPYRVIKRNNNK